MRLRMWILGLVCYRVHSHQMALNLFLMQTYLVSRSRSRPTKHSSLSFPAQRGQPQRRQWKTLKPYVHRPTFCSLDVNEVPNGPSLDPDPDAISTAAPPTAPWLSSVNN